jgi:hypothetical protein
VNRSSKTRGAALVIASAALLLTAAPAAAVAPSVESGTLHREFLFEECPDFSVIGTWDISHKLTIFYDSDGVAIRDIEQIEFTGQLVNATTGASVPDSGARIFFDTLAPDGSFLTTYVVQVRHSAYLHGAGRFDFQTGVYHGLPEIDPDKIAALCAALSD